MIFRGLCGAVLALILALFVAPHIWQAFVIAACMFCATVLIFGHDVKVERRHHESD